MKTRREFFKTLAGSMAVVAACVYAPKSLIAKEYTIYSKSIEISGAAGVAPVKGLESYIAKPYSHITSGHDQIHDEYLDSRTITLYDGTTTGHLNAANWNLHKGT